MFSFVFPQPVLELKRLNFKDFYSSVSDPELVRMQTEFQEFHSSNLDLFKQPLDFQQPESLVERASATEKYLKLSCHLFSLMLKQSPSKPLEFKWKTLLDVKKKPAPLFKLHKDKPDFNSHLLLIAYTAATFSAASGTAFAALANQQEGQVLKIESLKQSGVCYEKACQLFCLASSVFYARNEVKVECPEMNLNLCIAFGFLCMAQSRMGRFLVLFLQEDLTQESEMIYLAENVVDKLQKCLERFETLQAAERWALDYTCMAPNSVYKFVQVCQPIYAALNCTLLARRFFFRGGEHGLVGDPAYRTAVTYLDMAHEQLRAFEAKFAQAEALQWTCSSPQPLLRFQAFCQATLADIAKKNDQIYGGVRLQDRTGLAKNDFVPQLASQKSGDWQLLEQWRELI